MTKRITLHEEINWEPLKAKLSAIPVNSTEYIEIEIDGWDIGASVEHTGPDRWQGSTSLGLMSEPDVSLDDILYLYQHEWWCNVEDMKKAAEESVEFYF